MKKFQIFFSDIMKNCISVECTWMSVDDTIQFKDIRVIKQFELEKTFKICKYKLSWRPIWNDVVFHRIIMSLNVLQSQLHYTAF